MTYGHFLFAVEYPFLLTSSLNVLLYAWYIYLFVVEINNIKPVLDDKK